MSPLIKTLSLIVVAAVLSVVAAFYYPWATIEATSSSVGEPIFEDYEPTQVRRIAIQRYDQQQAAVQTIKLRRKGDRWLVATKQNFEASNTRQLAAVTNALLQREVLEEMSNKESEHSSFGVVDPALFETTANKSALGTKITLELASGKLASLIVGKPAEKRRNDDGTQKFFATVPGQPNVYLLNVNPEALTAQFAAWVQPNVLGFSNSIEYSLFYDRSDSSEAAEADGYRIQFDPNTILQQDRTLAFAKLQRRDASGQLQDARLANAAAPVDLSPEAAAQSTFAKIILMSRQIQQLFFLDVFSKPPAMVKQLTASSDELKPAEFQSLQSFGFQLERQVDGAPRFTATLGKVGVEFGNGLVVTVLLGKQVPTADSQLSQPARYAMLIARVDETLVAEPSKVDGDDAGADNAVSDEDAEKNEKAYLLAVKQREASLASSRVSASEFNRRHVNWIYAVPEQAVSNLLPELKFAPDDQEAAKPE